MVGRYGSASLSRAARSFPCVPSPAQDKVSIEITDKQAAAQENRKSLTDALMRFRRAGEGERAELFGSLVSKFKDEVDFLTRRARFGERAFVSLYSALFEAPDPAPPLAQGNRFAAELAEANAAVAQLKAERDAQARQVEALRGHDAEVRACVVATCWDLLESAGSSGCGVSWQPFTRQRQP